MFTLWPLHRPRENNRKVRLDALKAGSIYCQACGLKCSYLRVIEFHAIRPISQGGTILPRNKLALCAVCHTIADGFSQRDPAISRSVLIESIQRVRSTDTYIKIDNHEIVPVLSKP
jgi:hypothetical protein